MKNKTLRFILLLLIVVSSISCDQLSKQVARARLDYMQPVHVMDGFLSLIRVENTGAFLSLGHSWPMPLRIFVLVILPIASILSVTFYLFKRRKVSLLMVIAFGLIIGGGIGNLYDRVVFGHVTDFLHMDFHYFQTGVFNMADVSIMVGAFLMLLEIFLLPLIKGRPPAHKRGAA
ncbi:signal peptidase II [Niabella ginsenosidivorans]|uniref:Lipoprotein signal peptidase n=1 Tax=Niabella ginsenosidivorans TaxID=1176587 RepID=A0A1A9I5X4_9BACT|nr:signal peptidase II [Niabella ginsenosidivorans]ANH82110.1 signal peptidase II [Niabella ginsenosidivorans]